MIQDLYLLADRFAYCKVNLNPDIVQQRTPDSQIRTKSSDEEDKQDIEPTCWACLDTCSAYWTDGVFGTCMECNAHNVNDVTIVDEESR